MKPRLFVYDLAYGSFLSCGLIALIASASEAGLPNHDIAVGLSYLLVLLIVPIAGALLTGVILSLYLWRHWPLLVLSGTSILFVATMLLTEFGATKSFAMSVNVVYGLLVVAVSGLWFLFLRRGASPVVG